MTKPQCLYCGKTVLVSKHNFTEGHINPVTGTKELWRGHNICISEANETKAMLRLTEACAGDVDQAIRVRRMIMASPGSLTFWERR